MSVKSVWTVNNLQHTCYIYRHLTFICIYINRLCPCFAVQTLFVHQVPCSDLWVHLIYRRTSTPYLQVQTTLEEPGGTTETTRQLTHSLRHTHKHTHNHTPNAKTVPAGSLWRSSPTRAREGNLRSADLQILSTPRRRSTRDGRISTRSQSRTSRFNRAAVDTRDGGGAAAPWHGSPAPGWMVQDRPGDPAHVFQTRSKTLGFCPIGASQASQRPT